MKLKPRVPRVSVLMLTYNHEAFIAQAIQSVLMQETSFDFEIVIGEDCSTDRTREIVRDFQRRHPEKIRLLLPGHNLGMQRNYFQTLKACTGQYVAVLEGDDFWTAPDKLQKQVEYLDTNPDCVICFHNVRGFQEDGAGPSWLQCPDDQKEISTLEDLLVANFIPTCSTMFRNVETNEIPAWLTSVKFLDWSLHLLAARRGDIGYINETMAAYRAHSAGAYSSLRPIEVERARLELYESLKGNLGSSHDEAITDLVFHGRYALAVAYAKDGDRGNSAKYARLCLREHPFRKQLARKMKLVFRLRAPRLFRIARALIVRAHFVGEGVITAVNRIKARNIFSEKKRKTSRAGSAWSIRKPT